MKFQLNRGPAGSGWRKLKREFGCQAWWYIQYYTTFQFISTPPSNQNRSPGTRDQRKLNFVPGVQKREKEKGGVGKEGNDERGFLSSFFLHLIRLVALGAVQLVPLITSIHFLSIFSRPISDCVLVEGERQ